MITEYMNELRAYWPEETFSTINDARERRLRKFATWGKQQPTNLRWRKLRSNDVEKFMHDSLGSGTSPREIEMTLFDLSCMLDWAMVKGWVNLNAAAHTKLPPQLLKG